MTTELEEAKARLRALADGLANQMSISYATGTTYSDFKADREAQIEADLRALLSAVDGDGWPERLKLLADDLDLMAKVAEHDALSPHREDRERALLEGYASGLKDAASDVRELFAPPVPEGGE